METLKQKSFMSADLLTKFVNNNDIEVVSITGTSANYSASQVLYYREKTAKKSIGGAIKNIVGSK